MNPVILYRDFDLASGELEVAKQYFPCTDSRMTIKANDLVIGRYSVLPFYKEQEKDVKLAGAALINSYRQHNYVADLKEYVSDLGELTPKTWYRLEDIPETGPFVLKGKTNSKKFQWLTHMYAPDKKKAVEIYLKLQDDSLIGTQDIYIRQFVPLKRLATGLNGMPISLEFRFFVCYRQIVSGGFYWSSHVDDLSEVQRPSMVPLEFLHKVIDIIGDNCNFYALDVAQTESGDWIVVELNDGQMSGLSENKPDVFYGNLANVVK